MDGERLRVLVVDDDAVDRMAVRRALRAAGVDADVEEAGDVDDALAALRRGGWDCVFLDFRLPGGDGAQVLREARAAGITVPVVMLTGQEDTRVAVELMKAGAADYLAKGDLSPERLERSLRHVVRVHRAEEALRRRERQLADAHAIARLGSWEWEVTTDRVAWSDELFRIFGFEPGSVTPTRALFLSCVHPDDRERVAALMEEGVRADTAFEYEHRLLRPDGTVGFVAVRGSAVPDAAGGALRFFGVTQDVTERRRIEAERERALDSRSRFYAAMSHELRTPINAILGYQSLLMEGIYGEMPAPQRGALDRAHRAAGHLLHLVNDVLDLSKLEAGKLEVVAEQVRVPDLVVDLLATVRPLAEEHGTPLALHAEGCDDPVETDPRRVQQILLNLLSNAIKFGAGRPVEVRCHGVQGGVALEVQDAGEGIADTDLERVFEEFTQLPNAAAGGTGLGLSISKRLAALLGARLEAESEPGRGSTFRLTLPRVFPAALALSPGAAVPDSSEAPRPLPV